jgi:hypothetical protein
MVNKAIHNHCSHHGSCEDLMMPPSGASDALQTISWMMGQIVCQVNLPRLWLTQLAALPEAAGQTLEDPISPPALLARSLLIVEPDFPAQFAHIGWQRVRATALAIDDSSNLTALGTQVGIADLTCVNKNEERVVLRATVG